MEGQAGGLEDGTPSGVQWHSLGGGLKLETNVHVDFENKQNTAWGIFAQFQFAIASLLINNIFSDDDVGTCTYVPSLATQSPCKALKDTGAAVHHSTRMYNCKRRHQLHGLHASFLVIIIINHHHLFAQ